MARQLVANLVRSYDREWICVATPIEFFGRGPWEGDILYSSYFLTNPLFLVESKQFSKKENKDIIDLSKEPEAQRGLGI